MRFCDFMQIVLHILDITLDIENWCAGESGGVYFPVWVVDFFCDIQNNTGDYTKRGNVYA